MIQKQILVSMKKGTPTEAVLIEKVFDLVKDYEGDPVDLLESVTRKVLKYQREIQEGLLKKNIEKIKELADEIFELCPVCNFIPVVVQTDSGNDFVTNPDFDTIWEECCEYLCDEEDNDYELVMPYQHDDITFGDWKRVIEKWKEIVKLAGYKYKCEHDGDYCEDYHVSVEGFTKKKRKIEEFCDINR